MTTEVPEDYKEEGNELKTLVQGQAERFYFKSNHIRKVLFECYTGFGKTTIARRILTRLAENFIHGIDNVIVIAPNHLHSGWIELCRELLDKDSISFQVMSASAYTVSDRTKVWDTSLLIVDECHKILNELSEFFSTALGRTNSNNIILLSATIDKWHMPILKAHGFNRFKITRLWGYKNGLIPEYMIVCIPCKLDAVEVSMYMKAHLNAERAKSWCHARGLFDPYLRDEDKIERISMESGTEIKDIKRNLAIWTGQTTIRNGVLYKAEQRLLGAVELINKLPLKEQMLVYCMSKETANEISRLTQGRVVAVHSGTSEKKNELTKQKFLKKEIQGVVAVGKFKEGVDQPTLRLVIREAYNSSAGDTEQIGGRATRLDEDNPDKEALMVCFFIDDMQAFDTTIKSQDRVWLTKNLAKENNIHFVNSLGEGINYVLERLN